MRWSQAGHRGRPQRLHCTTARFVMWYAQFIKPAANFYAPVAAFSTLTITVFSLPPSMLLTILLLLLLPAVRVLLRVRPARPLRRRGTDESGGRALQLVGVTCAVGVSPRGQAQARVVHAADRAVGRARARAVDDR